MLVAYQRKADKNVFVTPQTATVSCKNPVEELAYLA
jgi:hypothetical protein